MPDTTYRLYITYVIVWQFNNDNNKKRTKIWVWSPYTQSTVYVYFLLGILCGRLTLHCILGPSGVSNASSLRAFASWNSANNAAIKAVR